MQESEKSKQTVKGLEANYRPIGPRMLIAALAYQARLDAHNKTGQKAPAKTVAA